MLLFPRARVFTGWGRRQPALTSHNTGGCARLFQFWEREMRGDFPIFSVGESAAGTALR